MHETSTEIVNTKCLFNVLNTTMDESIQSVKVIDQIQRRVKLQNRFYSIEISTHGNLSLNFNEFTVQPLFTSVAWFKDELKVQNKSKMPLAVQLRDTITSTATLLHLTCFELDEMILDRLLMLNIDNILALRGDNVAPNQPLKHAIDLIKLIKRKRPQTSLSVGGYPEVHPEAESNQSDIEHLKEKVEAGADFIIAQTCFSATHILNFIATCRQNGIQVPIIPGIFIPYSYDSLILICRICKVMVPQEDFEMYRKLKDDKLGFEDFAIQATVKILNDLFQYDTEPIFGIHFFTLNKFDLVKRVVDIVGFK